MSSNDIAIKVVNLGKSYNIYRKPIDRLKQSIFPRILRFLGKPSPSYYKEFWALENLNLEVKKGETVGIIGRNGSGKSTLLQLICGTVSSTCGNIETHGRITALLELGSGFNPEYTGRENVFINGAILGLSQKEIENRFDAIANFADIGEFIEQPVKFYSSGMIVRLAFSVQAMVDPDILIVDEALAVGDEIFQRKCFRRLEELKENGTSILFVSHSTTHIVELCDRAVLLEKGHRVLMGDPVSVTRAYQKIIYSNTEDQEHLIQEFKELDQNNQTKQSIVSMSTQKNRLLQVSSTSKIHEVDFFNSEMIPKSTEIYNSQGAKIESIKIYNHQEKLVNNLLFNNNYVIELNGIFTEKRELIYINFHIRNITAFPITGIRYPEFGKFIQDIEPNQKFCLRYTVKMNLLPDVYFVGAGIWSHTEPTCLHRVIDLSMFCVLPVSNGKAFGYVDITIDASKFELLEPYQKNQTEVYDNEKG